MTRKTKIVCTLGPASSSITMLRKMASRGMDISRLNFSHGSLSQHQAFIDMGREINKMTRYRIKFLGDLEGYRIRVAELPEPITLQKDQIVYMSAKQKYTPNHIVFDYEGDIQRIKQGMCIFIDDGTIALQVVGSRKGYLRLQVLQGGVVKSRKGINIPKLKLEANILTDKDRRDLEFAIINKVDFMAQSFVRNKRDVLRIVNIVKPRLPKCQIIAKIESEGGVRNIESIIDAADGITIARGDLGVSLPIYKIPMVQKDIIARCNKKKKFVITATQMLDNMIEHNRPTRAEVTDVANAILDGTDGVMLSAETAVGIYPSRCINTMRQIIDFTEKSKLYRNMKKMTV